MLSDGEIGDLDAHLGQFGLDASATPSGIGLSHPLNQGDEFAVDGGSSRVGPGFPSPEEVKAAAFRCGSSTRQPLPSVPARRQLRWPWTRFAFGKHRWLGFLEACRLAASKLPCFGRRAAIRPPARLSICRAANQPANLMAVTFASHFSIHSV
jgi:hypothetical protein